VRRFRCSRLGRGRIVGRQEPESGSERTEKPGTKPHQRMRWHMSDSPNSRTLLSSVSAIFSAPSAGTASRPSGLPRRRNTAPSPSILGSILAGPDATVKAGLRPPPSAALGLDSVSGPAVVAHHRFDASERLGAPWSTRAANTDHAARKVRIQTGDYRGQRSPGVISRKTCRRVVINSRFSANFPSFPC